MRYFRIIFSTNHKELSYKVKKKYTSRQKNNDPELIGYNEIVEVNFLLTNKQFYTMK